MKLLLLLAIGCAYSQTCQYSMVSYPSGAVQVYQNGLLLRQGSDYAYSKPSGKNPVINPLKWAAGDKFTVVYPHKVNLSSTVNGVVFPYIAYQQWQEIWDCPGTAAGVTKLNMLETCSGSGPSNASGMNQPWFSDVSYSNGVYVNYLDHLYIGLTGGNLNNQPDISPLWWRPVLWDCAGILRATIIRADGTLLQMVGIAGTFFAGGDWSPIK